MTKKRIPHARKSYPELRATARKHPENMASAETIRRRARDGLR